MPTMENISNKVHYTLLKGEPGTRKSTAALTWPKPQYWFSFDQKMNALQLPMKLWNIDPKMISYDDFNEWTPARQKLEQMAITCPYKTIVIDSITSCSDSMLRQTLKAKQGKKRGSGADAGKSIGGISVNEMEDFNAEAAGLTELIALTKDIKNYHKIDIILIAHVIRADYKSIDGTTHISRTLVTAAKKPAAKIPAYCDETYQFGWEASPIVGVAGDLVVQTVNNGEDYARTTLDLPAMIKLKNDNLYEKYIL